jgi:YD repeat-containing protein
VTLTDLQACLERLGVKLSARGNKLHFQAPKGVLTPAIKAALIDHKPALLASLGKAGAPVTAAAMAGPAPAPPTRPAPPTVHIVAQSTAVLNRRIAWDYAPGDPDALRRYWLRVESPLWPDDAAADDYRLAARLTTLHARGARAYRMEWNADDQSLADRITARRNTDI